MPRKTRISKDEISQHHVYISSKNKKVTEKTSNFTIEPLKGVEKAKQFSVDQVSFQNTIYNINEKNQRIVWRYHDQPFYYIFDITPGYYTHGQLADALHQGFRGPQFVSHQLNSIVQPPVAIKNNFYVIKLLEGKAYSWDDNGTIIYEYEDVNTDGTPKNNGNFAGSTCYPDPMNQRSRKLYKFLFVLKGTENLANPPPGPPDFTIYWNTITSKDELDPNYPVLQGREHVTNLSHILGFSHDKEYSTTPEKKDVNFFIRTFGGTVAQYRKDRFILPEGCYNLQSASYIYVLSNALTSHSPTHTYHSGNTPYSNLLVKLPMHEIEFGRVGVFDLKNLNFQWDQNYSAPIDVKLVDEKGNEIENNNGDVDLKLTFYNHEEFLD